MKPNRFNWMLILLLLIGAGVRIFGAWNARVIVDSDYGIAALMTKHMAEGREFPVFYYGQPYMGSLDQIIGAVFSRLFGCSGFTVNLGTACMAFLMLPVLYTWAREAGGRNAGLAALLFCLIGPEQFYYVQFIPRGSYGATLLFGTLVLWLGGRIVGQALYGNRTIGVGPMLGLGLAAGLGWWTNPIIASALLTVGILFIAGLRRRAFTPRVLLPGLGGFLLGSLPFWIWNMRHAWASFSFLNSFGVGFRQGLRLFAAKSLDLIAIPGAPPAVSLAAAGLYLAAIGSALAWLVWARARNRFGAAEIQLASAAIFLAFSLLVFSRSHFATFKTLRYLMPLVPALALVLGVATAQLVRRLPGGLGWVPLGLLIAGQIMPVVYTGRDAARLAQAKAAVNQIGAFLRGHDLRAIYADYPAHCLNFMLDEEFVFSPLRGERYPPYARAMETAERIAVLNYDGHLDHFLRATDARATTTQLVDIRRLGPAAEKIGPVFITYDLAPALHHAQLVPANEWADARDARGAAVGAILSDRRLDTYCTIPSPTLPDNWIEIQLCRPRPISGVRLISHTELSYPAVWRIQIRSPDADKWEEALPAQPVAFYFWSGPRPYWGGRSFRLESHFAPRQTTRLRIYAAAGDKPGTCADIAELMLLEPANADPPPAADWPAIIAHCQARGLTNFFTDRWAANQIHALAGKHIRVNLEPAVYAEGLTGGYLPLALSPATALLAQPADTILTRQTLAQCGIPTRVTVLGPWTLLDFAPDQWRDEFQRVTNIVWLGWGALLNTP